MRKVIKDFEDIPQSLISYEARNLLKIIIKTKVISKIKPNTKVSDIYNGKYESQDKSEGKEVLEKLHTFYFNKCAYCEDFGGYYIEHYRPKGRIINTKTKNEGYYWLCFEWSNLVPSCHECNRVGTAKGSHFPVKATYLKYIDCVENESLSIHKIQANYLNQVEQPYLLHPEIDDPKLFLGFRVDDNNKGVEIFGTDGKDGRGNKTTEICNLNRNDLLRKRRKNVVFQIAKDIRLKWGKLINKTIQKEAFRNELKEVFEHFNHEKDKLSETFTLLRWYVMETTENFQELVISQLDEDQREVTLAYFKAYKNGTL